MMAPSLASILLLSLLALTNVTHSFPTSLPGLQGTFVVELPLLLHDYFIRLAFHSSTRAGDFIYVDGGEINYLGSYAPGVSGTATLNGTLALDVSKSFNPKDIQYQYTAKPPQTPVLDFGSLWTLPDNRSFVSFGGVRSSFPAAPRLTDVEIWQHSALYWTVVPMTGWNSPGMTDSRPAVAASTYGGGYGYMLGGVKGNDHAPFWPLPGLLTYDMDNHSWTNESTSTISPYGMIGGSLTYVPAFGKQGVLIAMGGEYSGWSHWMEEASNFVPFTNISIWDIASKTWYWQQAIPNYNSSDVPLPAMLACTIGIASPDGTFEIFMFGGHNNTFVLNGKTASAIDTSNQGYFAEVYVLSLPSFTWTKVTSRGALARTGHTCELAGDRQMISIGGLNPYFSIAKAQNSPDPWGQGIGIFDLVDLKWKDDFSADAAPYVTPDVVKGWYKVHNTSSITWSSPDIESLFVLSKTSNDTLPPPTMTPVSSSGSTGNIAGPVVGSILAVLILIALSGWASWHTYKKTQRAAAAAKIRSDQSGTDSTNVATNDGLVTPPLAAHIGPVQDPIRGVHSPETMLATDVGGQNNRQFNNVSSGITTWARAIQTAVAVHHDELTEMESVVSSDPTLRGDGTFLRVSSALAHPVSITTPVDENGQPWPQHNASVAELVDEDGVTLPWGHRESSIMAPHLHPRPVSSVYNDDEWEVDEIEETAVESKDITEDTTAVDDAGVEENTVEFELDGVYHRISVSTNGSVETVVPGRY